MPARRPVLFDLTRLITRVSHPAPTGIDRVDLAYARRFLPPKGDGAAVALTPFGARLMPPSRTADVLGLIETRWREEPPGAADPEGERVRAWLAGAPSPARAAATPRPARLPRALLDRRWTADAFLWPRADKAPPDAAYLHTSHLRLDRPHLFAWLDGRPDIRPVFFVHDLIPIEHPEYGVPGEAARHRTRMATVSARAAAVAVNSADVGARLAAHLAAAGRPSSPPIRIAPLGVEPSFLAGAAPAPSPRPYFVIVSTIEGRKNHAFLLALWRDLAARHGVRTPALVVVGRRGWEAEAAADLLDRCEAIRPHVLEASGLTDFGLASLVAGARALLSPSFAEGYGIPVVEALSLGAPVVASDIPVHREVSAGRATLLDPLDGPGWRAAVEALAFGEPRRVAGFAPPTWAAHFAAVDALLASLDEGGAAEAGAGEDGRLAQRATLASTVRTASSKASRSWAT